jgi:hypothetical protein
MAICPKCKKDKLKPHENWRLNGVLIDPDTETAHKCNGADTIIQFGKWVGYTHKESAEIMFSVRKKDEERLSRLEEMFRVEPEPTEPVRVVSANLQDIRRPKQTLDKTFST